MESEPSTGGSGSETRTGRTLEALGVRDKPSDLDRLQARQGISIIARAAAMLTERFIVICDVPRLKNSRSCSRARARGGRQERQGAAIDGILVFMVFMDGRRSVMIMRTMAIGGVILLIPMAIWTAFRALSRSILYPGCSVPFPIAELLARQGVDLLSYRSSDGIDLRAAYHPPKRRESSVVVYFHGNAESAVSFSSSRCRENSDPRRHGQGAC
jgi:hypothetical protein